MSRTSIGIGVLIASVVSDSVLPFLLGLLALRTVSVAIWTLPSSSLLPEIQWFRKIHFVAQCALGTSLSNKKQCGLENQF